MKYSVINIGPMTSTIMAVRKPRELWSASYIFSYLMKCIIEEVTNNHKADFTIVSPSLDKQENTKVGIYPDRLFVRHETDKASIEPIIEKSAGYLANNLKLDIATVNGYFNFMVASGDYEKESAAIKGLNEKADALELFQFANNTEAKQRVINLIKNTQDSPLYDVAGFSNGRFPIETIAEIASKQLRSENEYEYDSAVNDSKRNFEDDLYKELKRVFEMKSYHKYFCVVQADGDNMGKIVSHYDLDGEKLQKISKALLNFGIDASNEIKSYGGLPIYAGGDDLLFLAPVKGLDGNNIFDLLDNIDICFKKVATATQEPSCLKDDRGYDIAPSMSYGISITYYKFSLYEACSKARSLLFDKAKKRKGKNAIEWELQKHSGAAFHGGLTKHKWVEKPEGLTQEDTEFYKAFKDLLKQTQDEALVSAVSHKIRFNESLINLWAEKADIRNERTDAFFEKFIDMTNNKMYKDSVKALMKAAYPVVQKHNEDKYEDKKETLVSLLYGMMQTAEFMNGEEVEQ